MVAETWVRHRATETVPASYRFMPSVEPLAVGTTAGESPNSASMLPTTGVAKLLVLMIDAAGALAPDGWRAMAPPVAVVSPEARPNPIVDALTWIEGTTGLSQERIAKLLRVSRQTVFNWRRGETISDEHRRHLLGVQDVLARALARCPSQAHLVAWLDTPRGADGRTPSEVIAAGELAKARLLAVTTPSPGVISRAIGSTQPIPQKWNSRPDRSIEPLWPEQDDLEGPLIAFDDEAKYPEERGSAG